MSDTVLRVNKGMTFYKTTNKKMRSNGIGIPVSLRIQYELGVWIEPKVGKIFVSEYVPLPRLDDHVYEVECQNPVMVELILPIWRLGATVHDILDYWDTLEHGCNQHKMGTWTCDAIKLVRRIK